MDPNKEQETGDNQERKSRFFKSLSKLWTRSKRADEQPSERENEQVMRANEIVVKENQNLPIFQLPDELLIRIIEWVPISQMASLELVSRRFQTIVLGLWQEIREIRLDILVYNKKKHYVLEGVLEYFLTRAPNVTSISGFAEFCDPYTMIRRQAIEVLSKFNRLESIDFSGKETWQGVINTNDFAMFLKSSSSRQCWKQLDIVGGIHGTVELHGAFGSKDNQPILNLECFKFSIDAICIFDQFLPPIEWSGLKKLVIIDSRDSPKEVLLREGF